MSKILYTAVVLDDKSHKLLVETFKDKINSDWRIIAHHMTIVFGEGLPSHIPNSAGDKVTLTATHLGLSKKAMAVKVKGFYSKNKIPHITIAVNVKEGGKPVQSNDITNWKPIPNIKLTGIVTEIKR